MPLSALWSHGRVIKAQVLAGGRGRGTFKNGFRGGVHVITHAGEAKDMASKMLNQVLVTKQTGPEGRQVGFCFVFSTNARLVGCRERAHCVRQQHPERG